jgi:hypothetical protein
MALPGRSAAQPRKRGRMPHSAGDVRVGVPVHPVARREAFRALLTAGVPSPGISAVTGIGKFRRLDTVSGPESRDEASATYRSQQPTPRAQGTNRRPHRLTRSQPRPHGPRQPENSPSPLAVVRYTCRTDNQTERRR